MTMLVEREITGDKQEILPANVPALNPEESAHALRLKAHLHLNEQIREEIKKNGTIGAFGAKVAGLRYNMIEEYFNSAIRVATDPSKRRAVLLDAKGN